MNIKGSALLAIIVLNILAMLAVAGFAFADTESTPSPWDKARADGVVFRGLGQEPGWTVEIREGEEIKFVTDYGRVEILAPIGEPEVDGAGVKVYRAQTYAINLMVKIEEVPHQDVMSGEEFPQTVTAILGDQEYVGGGRYL